ncbi:unnamed protein product [Psylliodes chrysocephalus]|uniref:UDP-glucuronosyltransferase n=1 Tax=Psylliodes chrysocephalus TaxID=3402493 RepID=A0A9P0G8Q3_9CUCU|nr:unnamed protein product [Psylliodes chrysocephala]
MKWFCLIFLCALNLAECYKILVVFPAAAPSHFILGNALGRGLAIAGHEVTVLSPFQDKNPPKNYREVVLTGFIEEKSEAMPFSVFDMEHMHPWLSVYLMNHFGTVAVNKTFEHPNFKKLLNEKFDLIIIEQFKNEAMKVLSCHFNAPLVMFSTIGANVWVNTDTANPSPPSYVPDLFLSYSSKMNLWQRTFNSLTKLFQVLNNNLVFFPSQRKFVQQYFPKCADYEFNNVSLYLLNSHESTSEPVPLVPSMINIGGFHINPPKELPKDLKEYLDNAKDGVIYFSMGSNIPFSQVKPEIKDTLIKVLGKLKQKVLWKYDEDTLHGKPDNVKLGKWFPQSDILAHPNVKLFITHGGLLSTLETIYHGVPVLTLPVFADQKLNAARMETLGYGVKLTFSALTEEDLTEALNKLLNDPKYRENAKLRSKLFHDRPIKPMDEMVYWVEYIVRHKGAPHLQVAGKHLPWYQYLLLDVVLLVLLIVTAPIALLYIICKKMCCSGGDKKKQKKKSKKE